MSFTSSKYLSHKQPFDNRIQLQKREKRKFSFKNRRSVHIHISHQGMWLAEIEKKKVNWIFVGGVVRYGKQSVLKDKNLFEGETRQ